MREAVLFALLLAPLASAGCGQTGDTVAGEWTDPVSVGPAQTTWDPHDLLDADGAEGLEAVTLSLFWTNGADGGADFGIAVGTSTGFQYWNQEFQTSTGDFSETLTLDRDDLEEVGWTGDGLTAGPSISTGGFSVQGIRYSLSWTVTYAEACQDASLDDGAGPDDPDGAGGGPGAGADQDGGRNGVARRLQAGLLAAGVVAAVAGVAAGMLTRR